MHSTSEALQILARQMDADKVSNHIEVEAKLAPLLCLILRTGQGYPSLLRWVRLAIPVVSAAWHFGGPVDPQWAALKLGRLLCVELLQDVRARRDTMVNRRTVVSVCGEKRRCENAYQAHVT
jgi:hypothetical protein